MYRLNRVKELHKVDKDTFTNEIINAHEPVILRGLVSNWDLTQLSDKESLLSYLKKNNVRNGSVETFIGAAENKGRFFYGNDFKSFNFQKVQEPLSIALNRFSSQQDTPENYIYIGSVPSSACIPDLRNSNPMPLLPDTLKPRLWVGNAVTVQTHYDTSHNIACVTSGKRTFILFPPSQTENLYMGPLEHTLSGPPVSQVQLENPDLEKFPRFSEAQKHALKAELEPGDAIYIPSLWWHHVQSFGNLNMLVNYWWNPTWKTSDTPFGCVVHGLMTIKDLPKEERLAWKALMDYLVFQPDQRALSTIPDPDRGVLGTLTPQRYQLIKNHLVGIIKSSLK